MTSPLVTVCVPAYNAAATIAKTLSSLAAQNYPCIELFVSDNRSTDETATIAASFPNVKVIRFLTGESNLGESNWNFALEQGSGEYIALYHADDLYEPSIVFRQAEFLSKNPEASCVFTLSTNIDEAGKPTGLGDCIRARDFEGRDIFNYEELLDFVLRKRNLLRTPTFMARRSALAKVGKFDPARFRSASDMDFWLRMARVGSVGVIPEALHGYRISAGQGTARLNRTRTAGADFFLAIDHHLSELKSPVPTDSLERYEGYRSLDELYCINNLLLQGNLPDALARYSARFDAGRHCLGGLRTYGIRFFRLFLITVVHLACCRAGLGPLGSKAYEGLYSWNLHRLRHKTGPNTLREGPTYARMKQ